MSDNELDRTLVPQEQSLDSVPYSTPPLVPPAGAGPDSSISTIVPTLPHRNRLDGRSDGAETAALVASAVETVVAPAIGAFVQPHPVPQHRLQLFRYPNAFARHHHPPATINKHEPKRACTSLPLYLSKSDLCSLVPRPGMEYVPLRTPAAETYHYHHVTDQTKSLQDLQNEVAALLEFRDLVIETFPDLKSKMASSAANSTLTGLPSTSSLGSRREWEPGIRIRRKLTQKEVGCADVVGGSSIGNGGNTSSTTIIPGTGDGGPSTSAGSGSTVTSSNTASSNTNASDLNHHHHHAHHQQQHSSSSLIRSRSNSHSGKKEPKSGEGNNGSVIQDSGFSNETSSSKETHSAASSTSGAVQGTLILPTATNRLGTDAGGELWNLLDVIHRKSSRLREEVDQHLERERPRATNLAISHHAPVHHHTQHFPQGVGSGDNNIIIHHSNPAAVGNVTTPVPTTLVANVPITPVSTTSSTTTTVVVSGGVPTAGKPFQRTHHLTDGEQNRQQQQQVVRSGSGTLADGTDHNVQILRKERDRLLDKLSEYEAEMIAGRIQTAKMQDEVEKLTLTMRDLQKQLTVANNQKQELHSKLHDLANTQNVNRSASSSPETITARQQPTVSQQQQTSPQLLKTSARYRKGSFGQDEAEVAGTEPPYPIIPGADTLTDGAVIDSRTLGWLDGFLGAPWVQRVRSLDSQKIAAILLETNIVGLQRHLLTVTVQNQILQQRLDQATGSRTFLQEKLEKSKEDIDDLRFQLKEKSIELEGTKAQLRVIESKTSSKSVPPSTAGSPERVVGTASTPPPPPSASTMIGTSNVHLQHHHQHLAQLAMRLQSSQVSTPSMKAMTPVVMDDIAQHQQHSSSTESTQDQPERDSIGIGGRLLHQTAPQQQLHHQQQQQQQPPETPRRRPSKIPLPGSKGSAAPKPPTGRNFSVTPTPTTPTTSAQRPLGGGGASSGPPSNRSLTKSTGSLYVKSTDASSFGQQSSHQQPAHQPPQPMARTRDTTSTSSGSLYRADSALSWRTSKDTPSLEKSRSSSIPVSAGKGTASGAPPSSPASTKASIVVYGGAVCSSPQPRAKRDNLTSKVKNCDSLSRLQSAQVSTHGSATGQLSKSGSRKELSSSPGSGISSGERKASIGGGGGGGGGGGVLRHASTASIGSTGQSDESATVAATTGSTTSTGNSNVKARRNNTFRLAKPTLTPLIVPDLPSCVGIVSPPPLPDITPSPDTYASSLKAVGRVRSQTATGSTTYKVPNSTATVRPSCSTSALCEDAGPRDLIGEYLAAKNRAATTYQQPTIPPPIFHVNADRQHLLVLQDQQQRQIDELAYKHPILLMDASEDDEEDEQDGVGKQPSKGQEVDDTGEERTGGQESLIVPRPKMNAFQSIKEQKDEGISGCRLVGKVNPNILKTWEQLFGGTGSACSHQRQSSDGIRADVDGEHSTTVTGTTTTTTTTTSGGSLELTSNVTSSEAGSEADDRQSCLLYCPQRQPYPYTLGDELYEFKVNRLQHPAGQQPSLSRHAPSQVSSSTTTCTTATARNSSDGVDFYDSIDAVSTCVSQAAVGNNDQQAVQDDLGSYDDAAGGEALAELTSLDRKRLRWSIVIE
ncbi:protein bunched, class 2/F/G isoform isoform X2 [Anopheles funestus]|uniref:protein bunched, class 2/F/G isoform isoform X2 n=1 Tax=Anopheles funestus TaxID=62324 RepID=UPI0020C70B49|nr:protein bunched, class 2/F/G isoform isoform X2 [Anopheles funestus]